ncbi:phosphoglucomutase [Flavobacterium aurantiibacter]|uniref:Phosphoglucomutase n=2 Tax=Flavobacterium aurantiibacter TaxID=2023067 RepID=A0A255ZTK2_9FLAO|nr:phospho-sugar mutase [Flavobacterium aurantiibacter]OYQ44225.1 phosphoglucomutase [Flavobacterium aurantiibacter]
MISTEILAKITTWKSDVFDAETKQQLHDLEAQGEKELLEAFYKDLEFGTGGMRGIMGVGTNRINKYTLGKSTQGLCDYLHSSFPNQSISVAIAFDCRHNSDTLAQVVANVFSANDIKVYLFESLRPTPELSFAVRKLQCQAGIVLTASHNPPEYNGYKVYWNDGGQLVPPQDKELIAVIDALHYQDIRFKPKPEHITKIGAEIDQEFIKSTIQNATILQKAGARDDLKIVFTSLHGTSITVVPETLKQAGYSQVHIVEEQKTPDGNFPTVVSPNPEEPEALTLALALAEKVGADIVIGTDPDCDRLGVAVRNNEGKMELLNGNQLMILLTALLLEKWQSEKRLNGKQFVGSTIVSTPMMHALAESYEVRCMVGLTGFKWIAKMIKDHPELEFIGGGEESFGYMVGDNVRDKDAVASTLLACELAAYAKASGSSVYNELQNLYLDLGYFHETLISLTKKGIDGLAEIQAMMAGFRNDPPRSVAGQEVIMIEDYQTSKSFDFTVNREEELDLPKSDVLIFYLADGSKIAMRPSGTEPKIKFYVSVTESVETLEELQAAKVECKEHVAAIVADLKLN